ncbi:MAG TPA: hypothetical protein VM124_00240 [Candidatus Limnocylindrales bacterium]|nr:hypothetical protein [Candidatus Limnocylindrales bacterium]
MSELFKYAGFGPNRHPVMMNAITGGAKVIGRVAILDVELCAQRMDQTPDEPVSEGLPTPRGILVPKWGPDRIAQVARRAPDKIIDGMLYEINPFELALLKEWELIDLGWKTQELVAVRRTDGTEIGTTEVALTDLITPDQEIDHILDGLLYPTYPNNNAAELHRAAEEVRRDQLG